MSPEECLAFAELCRYADEYEASARLYRHAQDDEERLAVIRGASGLCVHEGELVEVLGEAMEQPALIARRIAAVIAS